MFNSDFDDADVDDGVRRFDGGLPRARHHVVAGDCSDRDRVMLNACYDAVSGHVGGDVKAWEATASHLGNGLTTGGSDGSNVTNASAWVNSTGSLAAHAESAVATA